MIGEMILVGDGVDTTALRRRRKRISCVGHCGNFDFMVRRTRSKARLCFREQGGSLRCILIGDEEYLRRALVCGRKEQHDCGSLR
jgi:hypothetical protein